MHRNYVGLQLADKFLGIGILVGEPVDHAYNIPRKHIEQRRVNNRRIFILDDKVAKFVNTHSSKSASVGGSLIGKLGDACKELRFTPFIYVDGIGYSLALANFVA